MPAVWQLKRKVNLLTNPPQHCRKTMTILKQKSADESAFIAVLDRPIENGYNEKSASMHYQQVPLF